PTPGFVFLPRRPAATITSAAVHLPQAPPLIRSLRMKNHPTSTGIAHVRAALVLAALAGVAVAGCGRFFPGRQVAVTVAAPPPIAGPPEAGGGAGPPPPARQRQNARRRGAAAAEPPGPRPLHQQRVRPRAGRAARRGRRREGDALRPRLRRPAA